MKRVKNIFGSILWGLLFLVALPWFLCALVGQISGGLFQAFFNGFKRGVTTVDNFAYRFHTIQINNKAEKLKHEKK